MRSLSEQLPNGSRSWALGLVLAGCLLAVLLPTACSQAPRPGTPPVVETAPPEAAPAPDSPPQQTPELPPPPEPVTPVEPFPEADPETTAPEPTITPTAPPAPVLPRRIRVGLATDLGKVHLPCCGEVRSPASAEPWPLPLEVEAASGSVQAGTFRLQVAALKDERQAQQMAAQLKQQLGQDADAHFDAAVDLYRVRVGRYRSRDEAEAARRQLAPLGLADAWVVSEAGASAGGALRVVAGGKSWLIPGRELQLAPAAGSGVRFGGERYRGQLVVRINGRGRLNVINDLDLEDYLRGVVPKEMGPLLYNQLEALKAQAVAARTYTLRHLGEFAAEGYDICATPRCQVYGGMEVEHPLTTQAVRETAGQILRYDGSFVDARFTATCGGHTEDIEVVFPRVPPTAYLQGVPCLEGGLRTVRGAAREGSHFPDDLIRQVVPAASRDLREDLAIRLVGLARIAGLPLPDDRLASVARGEVRRFAASVFDLAVDPRLFDPGQPERNWRGVLDEAQRRQLAYLQRSGLLNGDPTALLGNAEAEQVLFHLAQLLSLLRGEDARFLDLAGGELAVRLRGKPVRYPLSPQLATFRRQGGRLVAGGLDLAPGDPVRLYLRGDRLVGLVFDTEPGPLQLERVGRNRSWTRFLSDRALAQAVQVRYPGFHLRGFEILERGSSGRVGRMRLLGESGRQVDVEGLAVRWTFELPETLFTASRQQRQGEDGWLFRGKGWGHGVGMCQLGAFGMAQRHLSYRDILAHYYPGSRLDGVVDSSS